MKLSVGIPFYNAASTLADTVRSVFAQTFQDWELMLLDDGSTDGSLQIAKSIRDPRVRVVSDGKNRGLIYRLNQLSDMARGEYYARMDADDLMHPRRLELQLERFAANPRVDVLATGMVGVDDELRPLGTQHCEPLALTTQNVLRRSDIAHPTVMARREWFRQYRYDAEFARAEDSELWCRAFLLGETTFDRVTEPLLFYREETLGSLGGKWVASFRTAKKIVSQYGPPVLGWRGTRMELTKLQFKIIAFAVLPADFVRWQLRRKRYSTLTPEEYAAYSATIEKVKSTYVPGLDDRRSSIAA